MPLINFNLVFDIDRSNYFSPDYDSIFHTIGIADFSINSYYDMNCFNEFVNIIGIDKIKNFIDNEYSSNRKKYFQENSITIEEEIEVSTEMMFYLKLKLGDELYKIFPILSYVTGEFNDN